MLEVIDVEDHPAVSEEHPETNLYYLWMDNVCDTPTQYNSY